ncbi:MAG: cytochrome C oxidase subunit IV family protein [Candidatus Schekmanbacteria bacterium]|nr:cytochrome C oxidase subunit IV family protein [Candidatus Schekmanbacteria bacterium]
MLNNINDKMKNRTTSSNGSSHHSVNYGVYIYTWLALLVLAGLTVVVAKMNLGRLSIVTALAIAAVKSVLVLFVFMNLRNEERLFRIMLSVSVIVLFLIIAFTFFDISFR